MKTAGNPWMKFYPSDWRADPALRSCSIAARGLWVEMLCIMHEAEPYGSLLIAGARIDKKRMATLAGISEKECTTLLLELEGLAVFSRDDDGTIYSRRMRRDAAKSEEGRKQVTKRWGDRSPNRSPTPETDAGPNTQKPEARSQEKKETREAALSYDFEFAGFWEAWPNKVGKPAALKAFISARKRAGLDAIVDGVFAYIRGKPPDRPWLNPATFLNQNRWDDQPATVSPANGKTGSKIIQASDDLRRKIASFDGPPRGPDELRSGPGEASPRLLSHG